MPRNYSTRYMEFRDAGLVPLARDVAVVFAECADAPADRRLSDIQLDSAGGARKRCPITAAVTC